MLRSPFIAIAAYEQEQGIPANYLNCSMYVFTSFLFDSYFSACSFYTVPPVVHKARGNDSNGGNFSCSSFTESSGRICQIRQTEMRGTKNIVQEKG